MALYTYYPSGTCSQQITVDIKDGVLRDVQFLGGCHGNLQGIAMLVRGMSVAEVINRLEGIRCGLKPTSCPDQLARALRLATQQ